MRFVHPLSSLVKREKITRQDPRRPLPKKNKFLFYRLEMEFEEVLKIYPHIVRNGKTDDPSEHVQILPLRHPELTLEFMDAIIVFL